MGQGLEISKFYLTGEKSVVYYSMSKKHFIAIAAIIANSYSNKEEISRELAVYFKDINPNFDRERFLEACGVE